MYVYSKKIFITKWKTLSFILNTIWYITSRIIRITDVKRSFYSINNDNTIIIVNFIELL